MSLISFSYLLMLVCKHTRDLCILILCPETLLNLLVGSDSFLELFLGFSMCNIMSSANNNSCTFPIWIPFLSFSSLIAVARTSKTMLNESNDNGHPCLVPNKGRFLNSFSLLRMMLAVGLSYVAFIMLRFVHAKSLRLCLTLCDPMDHSLPGSSVHGILQARILDWVAISFSRGSSWPRDRTCISCIGRLILYSQATQEAPVIPTWVLFVDVWKSLISSSFFLEQPSPTWAWLTPLLDLGLSSSCVSKGKPSLMPDLGWESSPGHLHILFCPLLQLWFSVLLNHTAPAKLPDAGVPPQCMSGGQGLWLTLSVFLVPGQHSLSLCMNTVQWIMSQGYLNDILKHFPKYVPRNTISTEL